MFKPDGGVAHHRAFAATEARAITIVVRSDIVGYLSGVEVRASVGSQARRSVCLRSNAGARR